MTNEEKDEEEIFEQIAHTWDLALKELKEINKTLDKINERLDKT